MPTVPKASLIASIAVDNGNQARWTPNCQQTLTVSESATVPAMPMPQARLNDNFSRYSSFVQIRAVLAAQKDSILQTLNFHDEHGKLGEFEGKFDSQTSLFIEELIDEIAAVLIEAL